MAELEEGPGRGALNRPGTAHGEHDAVWLGGLLARHVKHADKPPVGKPVVTDARVGGKVVGRGRGHNRTEKRIGFDVDTAIGRSVSFVEGPDASVEGGDELGRPDSAHGVGWKA